MITAIAVTILASALAHMPAHADTHARVYDKDNDFSSLAVGILAMNTAHTPTIAPVTPIMSVESAAAILAGNSSGWKKGPLPANTWQWGGVMLQGEGTNSLWFADFCGDHVKLFGRKDKPRAEAREIAYYNNSLVSPLPKDVKEYGAIQMFRTVGTCVCFPDCKCRHGGCGDENCPTRIKSISSVAAITKMEIEPEENNIDNTKTPISKTATRVVYSHGEYRLHSYRSCNASGNSCSTTYQWKWYPVGNSYQQNQQYNNAQRGYTYRRRAW